MSNVMKLPNDWDRTESGRRLIGEGWYVVIVEDATLQDGDRVAVVFKIVDGGAFRDWRVYESFPLAYEWARRMFKEFLDVVGIDQSSGSIDLNSCQGRVLRVKIKHRAGRDGQIWANVAKHMRHAP